MKTNLAVISQKLAQSLEEINYFCDPDAGGQCSGRCAIVLCCSGEELQRRVGTGPELRHRAAQRRHPDASLR